MPEETINPAASSSTAPNSAPDSGSTSQTSTPSPETTQIVADKGSPVVKSESASEKRTKNKAGLRDVIAAGLKTAQSGDPSKPLEPKEPGTTDSELNPDGSKKDATEEAKKKEEDTRLDKHPRFAEVIKKNKQMAEQMARMAPEVEDYRKMRDFMKTHNLNDQEVFKGFEVMREMKNSPIKALEMLTPYILEMQRFTGMILPDDLQKQVDEGYVTPQLAAEIVKNRNQTALMSTQQQLRAQQEQQAARQQQEANVAQQRSAEITQAVSNWEQRVSATDPDYKVKEKYLLRAIKAELYERPPRTSQEAVETVDRIYKEVSNDLRGDLPRRQAINPISSTSHPSNGTPKQHKSIRDAVEGALLNPSVA